MSDLIIIGVDHGYAAMKTAHISFSTGLVEYEHEPYTQKDVLEYGGKYYVVGSARQPLQRDKTRTEDYYLLTLAAIAKELDYSPARIVAMRMTLPIYGRSLWHCCGQSGFPSWPPPASGRMTMETRRMCWRRRESSRDGR